MLIAFALELMPALGVGLLVGRRFPGLASRLAQPLVRWGVPFSLMGLLLRSGLSWSTAQVALLALLAVASGLLLLRSWMVRPVEQLGAVVGNTAYFGIPAALALLPPQAVGYAISYDLAATLFTWSLGPLLLAGRSLRPAPLFQALVTSPAFRGLVGAALVQLTPWHQALAHWLWWPARVVVLVSLALVGMRLAQAGHAALPWRLWPVLAIKLMLFPLAVLAGLRLLAALPLAISPWALPSLAQASLVLQAAAPTAVSVLLLAEAEGSTADPSAAAALVLWSTLLALVTVPLWAVLLRSPGWGG